MSYWLAKRGSQFDKMVALGNSSLGANEAQSRSRPVSVPVWVFFRVRANVRVWGWAESTIVL